MDSLTPNREYKDSVFVDLFSLDEKTRYDAVIPFYNEFHNKKLSRKEEVRFVRLENILFRKVRNDVSFIAEGRLLLLLEHQSTVNVNMPFRCLEYALSLYQKELEAKETLIKARRAFDQRFLLTFSSCHKICVMATYRKLKNL